MSEIHFAFGAIAIGYVGLVLLIAKMCAFNDLVGCSGNCNQGRTQCDCQEARDA